MEGSSGSSRNGSRSIKNSQDSPFLYFLLLLRRVGPLARSCWRTATESSKRPVPPTGTAAWTSDVVPVSVRGATSASRVCRRTTSRARSGGQEDDELEE